MAQTPLNALVAFLTVARRQSFAAAARELGVSPSALSQAVRHLEARLGAPILSRTTRSVALTATGRRLVEQAGPGVAQALEALKSATLRPGELTGAVRLSVPEIATRFLTPALARFAARHARVEVELRIDNRLVDIVAEGFDAGVRLEEFVERDMVTVRLTRPCRFVVVASPSYLAKHGTPQRPQDLLAHNCICFPSSTTGTIYPWDLERGRRTWKVPVRGTITANGEGPRLALAEAGLGLSYLFEPEASAAIAAGRLRVVLEDYAAHVPGLFVYFPSRAQVSPAFRAFVDVVREAGGHPPAGRAS